MQRAILVLVAIIIIGSSMYLWYLSESPALVASTVPTTENNDIGSDKAKLIALRLINTALQDGDFDEVIGDTFAYGPISIDQIEMEGFKKEYEFVHYGDKELYLLTGTGLCIVAVVPKDGSGGRVHWIWSPD